MSVIPHIILNFRLELNVNLEYCLVLLESTPWYDPRIGSAVVNPYRDAPVAQEIFLQELYVRYQVKHKDFIKLRWGAIVADFAWEWLYEGPGDDD